MSTRLEKDRAKAQQEKFQAILAGLLKDEDNKYCEDCDAKGPRWASWNLGIFLCIRCAGIHRNLGVHISRVKSVNLDSWTAEQVAMMQEMGNSRARAVYEANVPDSFRRPQTDSALEAFVRAKYEQKKYIAREWVPPKPTVPREYNGEWLEDDKAEKKKARSNKPASSLTLTNAPPPAAVSAQKTTSAEVKATAAASTPVEPKPQPQPPKPKSGSDDLLGLDAEVPPVQGGQGGDLLADIFGGSPATPAGSAAGGQQNLMGAQQNGSNEANLFESGGGSEQGDPKSAKDSIMALYGSGGQQQMFGVPEKKAPEPLTQESQLLTPAISPVWNNKMFTMYQPATEYCPPYYASPNPYFYSATGGMYMPQQQMYAGAMAPNPMMQQPQQQSMMGQPMQQGMMGMQQQPAMYGGMGQMPPQQMGGGMMGNQAGMMGRPGMGGQMMMQSAGAQQPMGQMPMQQQQMQQMQFQQMQQQMAAMKLGGGQMGMQPPQQTAMAGGSWGGTSTGQTLSTNLWQ